MRRIKYIQVSEIVDKVVGTIKEVCFKHPFEVVHVDYSLYIIVARSTRMVPRQKMLSDRTRS